MLQEIFQKIDNHVSDIENIQEFSDKLIREIEQLEELNSMLEKLKTNEYFSEIIKNIKVIETLEKRLIYLQKVQQIEAISNQLKSFIRTDNEKAYNLYKDLEQYQNFSPYLTELVLERLSYAGNILKEEFYKQFETLLDEIGWPFQSQGNSIGVHKHYRENFLSLFSKLSELDSTQGVALFLVQGLKQKVQFHFFSEKDTNRIDKPEWLFSYILKILSWHFEFCYSCLIGVSTNELVTLKQVFINELMLITKERVENDLEVIIKLPQNSLNSILLHYIDEVIKFDWEIYEEFNWLSSILDLFTVPQIFQIWLEIDIHFMQSQFLAIFNEKTWDQSEIVENEYNNIRNIIVLYDSLYVRYSRVFNEEIREKLVNRVQKWIVPQTILRYEDEFNETKHNIIHYESNPSLWAEWCSKLATFYQGLSHFQLFIVELQNEYFSDEHLTISKLKKVILDKIVSLVMYTVKEEIVTYTRNRAWFEVGQLKVKPVNKMLKQLLQHSSHELSKNILAYCLKDVESIFLANMKDKRVKEEVFGFLLSDIKSLCKEFGDWRESFEIISETLKRENLVK
ncbi:unnamed protein product [Blepharisma stoltei]|uniref:RAD50-interacting protein 1 n=1 Tax=Blepharisma stoltei TaxID=1481888 RepID=A0AAU9I817_9CILI|nr:unnamed protein product [Blepharisma stoltei]